MEDCIMLRQMRSGFKNLKWALWAVIIAFAGGFIITDAFVGKSRDTSGLIYLDGDAVVQAGEYQRRLELTLLNYKEQLKDKFNKAMVRQFGLPERLLQEFVEKVVIGREADKLDITATQAELKEKIRQFPYFQKDGKFIGWELYHRIVTRGMNMKVETFEQQLMDEIVKEKFQALVTGSLVIDPNSLKDKFKKEKDQVELDYILMRPNRVKKTFDVTEEEIAAHYNAHKEDFKSSERRAGYVVMLLFDDLKKDVKLDPKAPYDYFMAHKGEFKVTGKTKVSRIFLEYDAKNREEIYQKAKALKAELTKDNFAAKAMEMSNGPKAKMGGDHGYNGWQSFTKQEKSLVTSLKEHEISPPVDTLKGFALLMITEKIAAKQQSFNDVKPKIISTMQDRKVKNLVQDKLEKLHKAMDKDADLKAKAEELGMKVIETELLSPGQKIKDIDPMGYISRSFFGMEKEKEVKFPVQFPKGMAVAQLTKIEAPAVETLEKAKPRVKAKVIEKKKAETLKTDAKTLVAELKAAKDDKALKDLLKKKDLKLDSLNYRRGNRFSYMKTKEGLDDLIFGMTKNTFSEPIEFDTEVLIVKVKNIKVASDADFEKEKHKYYAQKINEIRRGYFASYLSNKKDAYKVTYNQELFEKIKEEALSRIN